MFSTYKVSEAMTMDGNIYLLQYGSYISRNVMEENIKKLDNYLVIEEDSKYYVYVGAFINYENAHKLQKIFESKNIYTYLKNDYVSSEIIAKVKNIEKDVLESDKDLLIINNEILKILKEM